MQQALFETIKALVIQEKIFRMLTPDFIRHEIDAINEKWREIQKGSERKGAADWLLVGAKSPDCVSTPTSCNSAS
jgi:hypothetical protein